MADRAAAHYRIERVGRLVYWVYLVTPWKVPDTMAGADGGWFAMETGPWWALGRTRAERLGIRKLRAHLRREAWKAEYQ